MFHRVATILVAGPFLAGCRPAPLPPISRPPRRRRALSPHIAFDAEGRQSGERRSRPGRGGDVHLPQHGQRAAPHPLREAWLRLHGGLVRRGHPAREGGKHQSQHPHGEPEGSDRQIDHGDPRRRDSATDRPRRDRQGRRKRGRLSFRGDAARPASEGIRESREAPHPERMRPSRGRSRVSGLAASATWLKTSARKVDAAEPAADGMPPAQPGDFVLSVQADGAPGREPRGKRHASRPDLRGSRSDHDSGHGQRSGGGHPAAGGIGLHRRTRTLPEGATGEVLATIREDLDPKTLTLRSEDPAFVVRADPPGSGRSASSSPGRGRGRRPPTRRPFTSRSVRRRSTCRCGSSALERRRP
mgnify:CR=1 FL=1